jgi:hypothetical protein
MSQPSRASRHRRSVLILYWIAAFVATHWPEIERWTPESFWLFPHQDKAIHATMYAGWVGLWWWVLSAGRARLNRATLNWLVLGGVAYAIFDESTQRIVGRTTELGDLAADLAGTLLAVTLLDLRQRRRAGRPG